MIKSVASYKRKKRRIGLLILHVLHQIAGLAVQ